MDETGTTVSAPLTDDQKRIVNAIIGSTPAIALPHGGMGRRPESFADLMTVMESIVSHLKDEMEHNQDLRANLDSIGSDLAAAGRIFNRMGWTGR